MKITRKKEITWERTRRVTIKFNDGRIEKFCPGCQADAAFLTIDEAAVFRRTTARAIFRLVETGQIHFEETSAGRLYVCLPSLSEIPEGGTGFLTGGVEE